MRPLQRKSRNLHAWELVTAFKVSNCAAFHSFHCTVQEMGHQYMDLYRPFKAGHHLGSPETCSAFRVLTAGEYSSRRHMWFCICTAHFVLSLALPPTSDSSQLPYKTCRQNHTETQRTQDLHDAARCTVTWGTDNSPYQCWTTLWFFPVWHPFFPFLTSLLFGQAPYVT